MCPCKVGDVTKITSKSNSTDPAMLKLLASLGSGGVVYIAYYLIIMLTLHDLLLYIHMSSIQEMTKLAIGQSTVNLYVRIH